MKNIGELKKRIKLVTPTQQTKYSKIILAKNPDLPPLLQSMRPMLFYDIDEAKKEFPHIEEHGNEMYSFKPFEFEKWFLKWFGDR